MCELQDTDGPGGAALATIGVRLGELRTAHGTGQDVRIAVPVATDTSGSQVPAYYNSSDFRHLVQHISIECMTIDEAQMC